MRELNRRMYTVVTGVVMLVLCALSMSAQRGAGGGQTAGGSSDAARQLQAAINLQTVDGRLEEAAAAYQKIVASFPSNRQVVAAALLRMAQCHEQLGTRRAADIYLRIVREFGDQRDAATQAKSRLAALGSTGSGGAGTATSGGPSSGAVVRTLWKERGASTWAAISPDGRLLAYDGGRRLVVREIATGRMRDLGDFKDGNEPLVWSPDGTRLAYVNWSESEDIRIVQVETGATRTLWRASETDRTDYVLDWAKDSRFLAAVLLGPRSANRHRLVLIDASTGATTPVGIVARPDNIRFSPDGRFLALTTVQFGTNTHRVTVISTRPTSEPNAIDFGGDAELLDWTPDGKGIVVFAQKDGQTSLVLQPLRDGVAVGSTALLRAEVNAQFASTAGRILANGSVVYGQSTTTDELMLGETDLPAGRVVKPAARADGAPLIGAHSPSWSSDGTRLAFLTSTTGSPTRADKLSVLLPAEKRLTQVPLDVTVHPVLNAPRWVDSMDAVYLDSSWAVSDKPAGLYRTTLSTGRMALVSPSGAGPRECIWPVPMDNGRQLLHTRAAPASTQIAGKPAVFSIYRRSVATGEDEELYRNVEPGFMFSPLVLSRDERLVAYTYRPASTNGPERTVASVLDLSTTKVRRVTVPSEGYGRAGAFSSDNRYLLWLVTPTTGSTQLWVANLESGEARLIPLDMRGRVSQVALNRDDRRVAFSVSMSGDNQIMAIDNLLPAASAPLPAKNSKQK